MAEHPEKRASDTLVLASGNAGKLREFSELLEPLGMRVRPQSDWETPEAAETGLTFVENALLKARNAASHTGHAALADDSGLVVPALGGAPGIHSARYSREGTDSANNAQLLADMDELAGDQRAAYFYCALVLLKSARDPAPVVVTGAWHGRILLSPRGGGGFGYDPLFFVPGEDCASAELPAMTKNRISHRGQAVAALLTALGQR
ncbi:MAG: RdgB/HAM1 family non-canonical purine NTP pyrophosphatase [Xanthomonadales bacterium]|jgi:XTP/dITP diphosphohydrolase|nr:RdgB/HAM1 family non-canonical purine NTP pyrophosphatase [Xanthomonadales bacterium]